MAEPLKNNYGTEIPRRIAAMIAAVFPEFPAGVFLRGCLDGYEALELMPRARHISRHLAAHLPPDFPRAAGILIASLGPKLDLEADNGFSAFLYLPHVFFVAENGLSHPEESLRAHYELTQRFTAEFGIRPFIEKHPGLTLGRLRDWTRDPSEHVRRLVSEGTRPRLPWAPRLPGFQKNPAPVLELLELLKDDPSLYVRRSVANNLNDIGKDHPELLVATARRWLRDAPEERQWIVRHGLRSLIKAGHPGALAALGFQTATQADVLNASLTPGRTAIGGKVRVSFDIRNPGATSRSLLVDFRVHFVKASGSTAPKVFKLKVVELAPGETVRLSKLVSLAELTTRKHYPGTHRVEALLNGNPVALGSFEVR